MRLNEENMRLNEEKMCQGKTKQIFRKALREFKNRGESSQGFRKLKKVLATVQEA